MRAWFTPPAARKTTPADLDGVETLNVELAHGAITVDAIGDGPIVFLLHGWGADPRRLLPLARALAECGHRSIVPHLPGRAGSARTDVLEVVDVLRQLAEHQGTPVAVVAHSFGAMVARLAFGANEVDKAVYLAPLVKVSDALDRFAEMLGLMPWVRAGIHTRLRAWNPSLWPVVNAVRPDQLTGAEMLILHDPDDTDTSYDRSAMLAALRSRTRIEAVSGVGHHRILSDPSAIESVVQFVTARRVESLAV